MKTVVLQSYRTHHVPQWLNRCLESVRAWASARGWGYEFLDDRFFLLAPDWARQRCGDNIYAVTDICRLQWMRDQLDAGVERVIWADADLLVFRPSLLNVETPNGYAFAHEIFFKLDPGGGFTPIEGVNNSMMVFEQDQDMLDAYLELCLERLRTLPSGAVPRTALGPTLLGEFNAGRSLDLLHGVGLFTPALMKEIAGGGGVLTQQLAKRSPAQLGAANLCHFIRNAIPVGKRAQFDALYGVAVKRLVESSDTVLL